MTDKEKELQLKINTLEKEIEKLKKSVKKKKYGIVWMDVPEAFEDDFENKLPILTEVKDKAIINNDDKPTHILIEGDNYHALTCLNYTHKEKIDVIYIDPPYNTGSDGFRYKDKRLLDKFPDGQAVPKDHPFRHTYWLSFMKKRLELARNLLKNNGFIFISIDDNEYSQLKLLCDEIFYESNFIMPIYVQVRYPGKTLVEDMGIQKLMETVLIYRKNNNSNLNQENEDYSFDKFCWKIIEKAKPKIIELGGKKVEIFQDGQYEIVKTLPDKDLFKEIWATGKILDGNSSGRFFRDYLQGRYEKDGFNILYKVDGIGDDKYSYRYFTGPKKIGATKGKYFQGVPQDVLDDDNYKKSKPIVNYVNFADNFGNCRQEGGVEFRSGKKPIAYLKYLLKLGLKENKNNIILDFFAGSGSSAHALLDINDEENKKNQFILVTNNENNIMSEICYPRIKNIIKGYNNKDGYGNSLKYYKTDFVGKNKIKYTDDFDAIDLAHKAGYLLAIAENTLFELENKTNKFFQFFGNNNDKEKKYTAVYFREELDKLNDFVKEVSKLKNKTTVYIFSWGEVSEYAFEFDDFVNVRVKTIPQPILEVYKSIYNLEEEC